ncbi:hypothetical protein RF11_10513 [Thelohanellus kitauei]|uniref:Uncharacterized protein n=1 Tax=Thelohanellus kitauei TaxID=669202 RepID=A0A0C2M8M9_THEKT|nr:hypothetical protein RF11_10513 [Thelohanellus kitauei]
MIDQDFIKDLFSRCELHLINDIQKHLPKKISENNDFRTYKQVMAWVLLSFNESNYINFRTSNYYLGLCLKRLNYLPEFKDYPDNYGIIRDDTSVSTTSEETNIYYQTAFRALFRSFILIFELKYIFGDINSKYEKLDFLLSL